jgi:hypothetical protein
MPNGVLIGTDSGSDQSLNGVCRMNPLDREQISVVYETSIARTGLTHLGAGTRIGADGLGYMVFSPWQNAKFSSILFVSEDRTSVQEVWRDPSPAAIDVGRQLRTAMGPYKNGNIVGWMSADTSNGWRVVAPAPKRGDAVAPRFNSGRAAGGSAVNQSTMAVGASAEARSNHSVAVGPLARAGVGANSGDNTAVGSDAQAGVGAAIQKSTAVGRSSRASAFGAIALGPEAISGQSGVAVGRAAAEFGAGVAVGDSATTGNYASMVIGQAASEGFLHATVVGCGAKAGSIDSVAVGWTAQADFRAMVFGSSAKATHTMSVALGQSTVTNDACQI